MTTVAEAADLFVAALHGRHAPPNTIKAYASDVRRFAGAVPADLAALDAAAIRAFLDGDALTSCIFVSALCGCRKPEAPIFLAVAAHLGIDPAHVLFVGDNPEADMWGARNAGMRTAWLRRGRSWPASVPASCVDLAIDALDDVLAMAGSRDGEA